MLLPYRSVNQRDMPLRQSKNRHQRSRRDGSTSNRVGIPRRTLYGCDYYKLVFFKSANTFFYLIFMNFAHLYMLVTRKRKVAHSATRS